MVQRNPYDPTIIRFALEMREYAANLLAQHLRVRRIDVLVAPTPGGPHLDALFRARCPAKYGAREFTVGIELASCAHVQRLLSAPNSHQIEKRAALISLAIPLLTVYTPVLLQAFRRPPRPERPERLKDDEIRAPVRRLRMHITREDFDDQDRR